MEILQFEFMRHAFVVGLLVSLACGVVGTYVVVKKLVFISGGISHSAYGGIGMGFFLGISPMLGAALFTSAAALAMGLISHYRKQSQDMIIGVIWAVGMAMGIIFVQLSPGYATDLLSFLFGNILTVPGTDVLLILVLDIIVMVLVLVFYEDFKAVSFDEEFAEVSGVNIIYVNLLLLFIVALTVVVMIRAVGIILVIALLTIPAAIAGEFTHNLKNMMIIAVVLGMIFTSSGLLLSFLYDLPSGATIILVAAAGYALSFFINKVSGRLLTRQCYQEAENC